jgi:hypothetical protein
VWALSALVTAAQEQPGQTQPAKALSVEVVQAWPGPRQLAQVDAQDRAVKQFEGGPRRLQRRQRLFLGSHDVFQKPAHGGAVQLTRMPLAVKQDIGPHPSHQLCGCRLRCAAVAGGLCDLVEQAWRL